MSKPKRASFVELLDESAVTPSRDDAVTLELSEPKAAALSPRKVASSPAVKAVPTPAAAASRRRSRNDNTRHSYHASLYLPEEAQFALREIALTMRRAKPHDVMLEAMAELFEKYNKGEIARQCRARITSRDKAVT